MIHPMKRVRTYPVMFFNPEAYVPVDDCEGVKGMQDTVEMDANAPPVAGITWTQHAKSEGGLHMYAVHLADIRERERRRLSFELHDGLCQLLGMIKYKVEAILAVAANGGQDARLDQLPDVVKDLRRAIGEVRNMAQNLCPPDLDNLGLVRALDCFCQQCLCVYGGIRIDRQIDLDEARLLGEQKHACYRIVQEAVNNIVQYARASTVTMELRQRAEQIYLCVHDDGCGFDIPGSVGQEGNSGLGLKSMQERARLTGGEFRIESVVGKGTSVQVWWPMPVL